MIPPKDSITEEDVVGIVEQAVKKYSNSTAHGKCLEDATVDELHELEDLEDDRVLEQYRQQRLREMQDIATKSRFGVVEQISKPEYSTKVTEASKEYPVIVTLFKEGLPLSKVLMAHMTTLARKYPASKFVSIVSDQCIENYPDQNVPTVILYLHGEALAQLLAATFVKLGGINLTVTRLEKELERYEVVEDLYKSASASRSRQKKDEDEDDVEEEERDGGRRFNIRSIAKTSAVADEDDDWN